MGACYSCGTELTFDRAYRTTICPGCGKGVRVCKNCKFYSPGSHWDCRETISEPVREKDIVNFCEYFVLKAKSGNSDAGDEKDDSRAAFDNLFGS